MSMQMIEGPQIDYARVRKEFGDLFDEVSGILFKHDPMGINFQHNTDEYDPEAAMVLERIGSAGTAADLRRLVHAVFMEMFNGCVPGTEESFEAVAQEIWSAWSRHRQ
jgi:hypothetical protein